MEVVGHDKKKILWEVVDDHVIEDPTDHDEIGLHRFDLNLFDEEEKRVGREVSSEFPCLLMLIKYMDWELEDSVTKDEFEGG